MYIKAEKTRLEKTKYKYYSGLTYIGSKIGTLSENTQYIASEDCVLYGTHSFSLSFNTTNTGTTKITLNIQENGVTIKMAEVSTIGLAANKKIKLNIGTGSEGSNRGIFIPKGTIISLIETYPSGGTKTTSSRLDIYTPMDND